METQTITSIKEMNKLKNNYVVSKSVSSVIFENSKIIFKGSNNYLFVDEDAILKSCKITFHGNNSIIYIKKTMNNKISLNAFLYNNSMLFFNENCSFNGILNIIVSESKKVLVGKDCMFSFNCWIRNSDVHMIYDDNNNRINFSKNIIIGDHVWVGQNVSILKGSYIGSGSVIGLGSVIAKKITSNDIYAGNPCKKVRENIFWDRQSSHFFTEEETNNNDKFFDDDTPYKFDKDNNLNEWLLISEKSLIDLNQNLITKYVGEICGLEPLVIYEPSKETLKAKLSRLFKKEM